MAQEHGKSLKDLEATIHVRTLARPAPQKKFSLFKKRLEQNTFLPICVSGGIGDIIMAAPLVRAIAKHTRVQVYCNYPDIAHIFIKVPCHHNKDFKRFQYSMMINSVVKFMLDDQFIGFRNAWLAEKYLHLQQSQIGWESYIYNHPWLDNLMAKKAVSMGLNRRTLPVHLLGMETPAPLRIPKSSLQPLHYITIHDGFENLDHIKGRVTKTWSIGNWNTFVSLFKHKYPTYKIFQIGGPKSRPISGVDYSYVNECTFEQSLRILQGAKLHVDGDSGLVHAAHAIGTPSVVLFGPTNLQFFGYQENINLAPNECGGCWWLSTDWMTKCPAGFDHPKCMDSISPWQVVDVIKERLLDGKSKAL